MVKKLKFDKTWWTQALGYFAMVIRRTHKVDICQTDSCIQSKLRIFPYSIVIHGSTTFNLTRLKKNDQLFDVLV